MDRGRAGKSTCLVLNDAVLGAGYEDPTLYLREIGQFGRRELADAYCVTLLLRAGNEVSQMGYHREVLGLIQKKGSDRRLKYLDIVAKELVSQLNKRQ